VGGDASGVLVFGCGLRVIVGAFLGGRTAIGVGLRFRSAGLFCVQVCSAQLIV